MKRDEDIIALCLKTTNSAALLAAAAHIEQEARDHDAAAERFKQRGYHYKAREAAYCARVLRRLAKQVSSL